MSTFFTVSSYAAAILLYFLFCCSTTSTQPTGGMASNGTAPYWMPEKKPGMFT